MAAAPPTTKEVAAEFSRTADTLLNVSPSVVSPEIIERLISTPTGADVGYFCKSRVTASLNPRNIANTKCVTRFVEKFSALGEDFQDTPVDKRSESAMVAESLGLFPVFDPQTPGDNAAARTALKRLIGTSISEAKDRLPARLAAVGDTLFGNGDASYELLLRIPLVELTKVATATDKAYAAAAVMADETFEYVPSGPYATILDNFTNSIESLIDTANDAMSSALESVESDNTNPVKAGIEDEFYKSISGKCQLGKMFATVQSKMLATTPSPTRAQSPAPGPRRKKGAAAPVEEAQPSADVVVLTENNAIVPVQKAAASDQANAERTPANRAKRNMCKKIILTMLGGAWFLLRAYFQIVYGTGFAIEGAFTEIPKLDISLAGVVTGGKSSEVLKQWMGNQYSIRYKTGTYLDVSDISFTENSLVGFWISRPATSDAVKEVSQRYGARSVNYAIAGLNVPIRRFFGVKYQVSPLLEGPTPQELKVLIADAVKNATFLEDVPQDLRRYVNPTNNRQYIQGEIFRTHELLFNYVIDWWNAILSIPENGVSSFLYSFYLVFYIYMAVHQSIMFQVNAYKAIKFLVTLPHLLGWRATEAVVDNGVDIGIDIVAGTIFNPFAWARGIQGLVYGPPPVPVPVVSADELAIARAAQLANQSAVRSPD
jgi:hypothetical protein